MKRNPWSYWSADRFSLAPPGYSVGQSHLFAFVTPQICTVNRLKISIQYGGKRVRPNAEEQVAAFVNDQTYAIEDVVEQKKLDCLCDLCHSFNVFLDAGEAKIVHESFKACARKCRRRAEKCDLIDRHGLEQILPRAVFLDDRMERNFAHCTHC